MIRADAGVRPDYPDVLGYRRKFGLVVPATNSSMEAELWRLIARNESLRGVSLLTGRVATPVPALDGPEALAAYGLQFLDNLSAAADTVALAQPDAMIMGMSLEHIRGTLADVRAPAARLEARTGLAWATWHDAAAAALRNYGARRVGLLTPFDAHGDANARSVFEELGFDVVASAGFACADAASIAHVPNWAKEKAIVEMLATRRNALDAVVQCGTNMSLIDVAERLEPVLGIPVLGVNAVTFWHAMRQTGFAGPIAGGGRLLLEF